MTRRERAIGWWALRTTREQRLILVMFGLLAATIAWAIITSVADATARARNRHAEAVIERAEVEGKIEALRGFGQASPLAAPLDGVIGQAASDTGFVLARNEAQGDGRVLTAIASARPQAFFGWLSELERRGIFPERLVARANSDRTLNVEATFRARGTP